MSNLVNTAKNFVDDADINNEIDEMIKLTAEHIKLFKTDRERLTYILGSLTTIGDELCDKLDSNKVDAEFCFGALFTAVAVNIEACVDLGIVDIQIDDKESNIAEGEFVEESKEDKENA